MPKMAFPPRHSRPTQTPFRVPLKVVLFLLLSLCLQALWHAHHPPTQAQVEDLSAPPSLAVLQLASIGEPEVLSRILMLWLQAMYHQSGVSLSFKDLNIDHVLMWLDRMLSLDAKGQYPLLAAARFFANVPVEKNQRLVGAFIYEQFFKDPNQRWPWLAHMAITAKHRLNDLPLARKYAVAIAKYATGPHVPSWAKQLEIPILEDMGELESARLLIGGLIQSGQITDSHELVFLNSRLQELEKKAAPLITLSK
ncbi:MAG: hypothetical protein H7832_12235 [Magnetococcus sp. DMHC-6]